MKKLKVGIFTGYFLPHMGGVERYTDKLAEALKRIGYDVIIVTFNHDNLKSYEKYENYTIYRLPILNLAKNRYPIPKINSKYKGLAKRINQEEIDCYILNTRFFLTSLIGSRMGKRNSKPVILIEHGTDHFTVNNRILDFLGHIYEHFITWLVKKNVNKFYGVSQKCNEWSRHFGIEASGVFYNSISIEDECKTGDKYMNKYCGDEIIITYAGRLIKEKGILNLLEVFRKINKNKLKSKPRLVVAGNGELLDKIKEKYQEKDIDILGKLDFADVMALYKRTDIFVHPSLYPEGLPTSILEAGLMNCAVIATPRGGTEEVITDSARGIIIDGSVRQLKEAMEYLINDSRARIKMAKKLNEHVKECFDWGRAAALVDEEIRKFEINEKN